MNKIIGIIFFCVSAVFAETPIDPADPNVANLVFCITNGTSIDTASSWQTESNTSQLSAALALNGFTIAATNFIWQSSSETNVLDVIAWRNVGNKRVVYLITCRYHSCYTNDERTVLMRDAEFGNSVATVLNENFRLNAQYYRHLLTFARPPKYQPGDHYGAAISNNVFYATGSFEEISSKILRNSDAYSSPFGKRGLFR